LPHTHRHTHTLPTGTHYTHCTLQNFFSRTAPALPVAVSGLAVPAGNIMDHHGYDALHFTIHTALHARAAPATRKKKATTAPRLAVGAP